MQNNQRDNDLQRAIDEITKKTVAANAPRPVQGPAPVAPAPVAASGMPPAAPVAPKPVATPAPAAPKPVEAPRPAEVSKPVEPTRPAETPKVSSEAPKSVSNEAKIAAPKATEGSKNVGEKKSSDNAMDEVKKAALKELFPLMSEIKVDAEKKYSLYKGMMDTMHDKEVFAPALEAAKNISDKTERANALLHVLNSIDEF